MDWWQALILGIVEGLTEYLPVSSTGHLLLTQRLLGIPQSTAADAYAIVIQAGAILAVVGLYWRRMKQMSLGILGRDASGLRLARHIVTAFIATVASYEIAKFILKKTLHQDVKEVLFNLPCITAAWLVGGLAILAVVYLRPRSAGDRVGGNASGHASGGGLDTLTLPQALVIGVMQALAVWPGTSRSLITIVAGVLVGLSVSAAVEFSFLLGVLTLLAACAKDLKEQGSALHANYSLAVMLLGVIVAGLAAAVAVKWMVRYLQRHSLAVFGWYRVLLAALVGLLMFLGKL